jgi:hypothetical protein
MIYLIVAVGEWFNLPRLGREFFISLMKAGLMYDKSKGFKAEANADLATISSILKTALGEDFEFVPKCFACNSIIECYSCAYYLICDVKSLAPNCLCDKCMGNEDAFAMYSKALIKKMS